MSQPNILIIVAQHHYCDTKYMIKYELGCKPVNSIWIHFYHLKKYLENRNIKYYPININNKLFDIKNIPKGINYCISIFNDVNGFKKTDIDNLDVIKKIKSIVKCKFILLTEVLCEKSYESLGKIFNIIYTNRTSNFDKTISLGFAANSTFLYPQKHNNIIRILVDHPAYNTKHFPIKDKTKYIIDSIFSKNFLPKQLLVRRFTNGNIETVLDNNIKIERYNRVGINILSAYSEYNHADIFFVTHPESMGLSVIECAMAGCLVVTPKGYINTEFLSGLNYVEFDNTIEWDLILSKLNPKLSRKLALKKSWDIFYSKLIT